MVDAADQHAGRLHPLVARTAMAVFALLLAALTGLDGSARADTVERRVLAIYDSHLEATPSDTMVHLRAEMPLNHLGYIVDYRDASQGLPDPETMSQYLAIVTWFTYDLPEPTAYLHWARKVAEKRVPFIIFGSIGVPTTPRNISLFNRVLEPMGIQYTTGYVESTFGTKVLASDPAIIGFERPLDALLPSYPIIRRVSADAQVALEVEAPKRELGATSALVTVGPGGAFVPGQFGLYVDPVLNRTQWLVNPFAVFERTLGKRTFPIPDTTTVSGRRLYFSHVDGDGWNDTVEMERFRDPPVAAAEIMRQALIAPYPDLPVTVGVVIADLDPVLGGGEEAADIARKIYALPQVEVASHTRTAPIDWEFYEHYSRAEEEQLIRGGSTSDKMSFLDGISVALGLTKLASSDEGTRAYYRSGSRPLPRAFLRDPFSIESEISGAVTETNSLAPKDKPAQLYQWSGDARPFAGAIGETRRIGVRNINGGGSRLDDDYNSVGYVLPIARTIGGERQIYAVDANENTFTSEWTDNFGGFADLRETLDNTESPRRLKGANVYYHAYSAKTQASLTAVIKLLDWARSAPLAPITASAYAAIADGFFSTEIDQLGPMSWRIGKRDGLQTVRFEDAAGLDLDIAASSGVVGSTIYDGSLYVALDAAVAEAVVSLRSRASEQAFDGTTSAALESGRWLVRDLHRAECAFTFEASGYGSSQFAWRNLAVGDYKIEARRGTEVVWKSDYRVADDSKLAIDVPVEGIQPMQFTVTCSSPGSQS